VSDKGFMISRNQIALNTPIKMIGRHAVPITLHPEVEVKISIIVARNADEAERIARGEDLTVARGEQEEAAASATEGSTEAADAFFEPEAAETRRAREEAGAAPGGTPGAGEKG